MESIKEIRFSINLIFSMIVPKNENQEILLTKTDRTILLMELERIERNNNKLEKELI